MKKFIHVFMFLIGMTLGIHGSELEESKLYENTLFEDEKACNSRDYDACFGLGQKYAEGINVNKNATKAAKLYEKACSGGSEGGCFNLAVAYRHGQGVEQNNSKAVELYRKVCEMGGADGCTNLAFMYDKGLGVEKDISKAFAFSKKGCEGNDTQACYNLSLKYIEKKEFTKAKETAIKACNNGHAGACFNIGLMYTMGDGVAEDQDQAYNFFSKACDSGLAEGCDYAKSNFTTHITGGDETITVENGLGYEYRNDTAKAASLIINGKFKEANEILDEVINNFESKYIKDHRYFISAKTKKDFNEYVNIHNIKNAIWLDFSYRNAYYYKAFIAIELKEYDVAIRILKRLTFISPNDSQIHTELGGIYNKTSRAQKGLVEYKTAYAIAKQYGQNVAVALRGAGFSYIELGELTRAKKAYELSLQYDPNNKIALDEISYIEQLENRGK